MGITAKELAKKLNLSAAAVSMALHDQPGVSTETRKRVKLAAGKYGYDLSRIQNRKAQGGSIDFLVYKKSGAIVGDTPGSLTPKSPESLEKALFFRQIKFCVYGNTVIYVV